MKIIKLIIFILLFGLSFAIAQDNKSVINIVLEGELKGSHTISGLFPARIQNGAIQSHSTIGVSTDPPAESGKFDIAMVLGNMTGQPINVGSYKAVSVIKDQPLFEVGAKNGFLTLVTYNNDNKKRMEFYTQSGEFVVNFADDKKISGIFNLILKDTTGNKSVSANGSFEIYP